MKKQGQANAMIILLMVIIIAMVSISVVWGLIRSQQDTTAITSDPFTPQNGSCVRVTDLCINPGSTTAILNDSDGVNLLNNFTECGTTGSLYGYESIPGTVPSTIGVQANATYTEQACGRITGFTGTIIDYIPLLMAVLILVFVAGFAIK